MQQALNIAILGSTGSVGSNLIKLLRNDYQNVKVVAMSAGKNVLQLAKLAKEFSVKKLVVEEGSVARLSDALNDLKISSVIKKGSAGLIEVAKDAKVDLLFILLSGQHGLKPLEAALTAGKQVALANKESLVLAGSLINRLIKQHKGAVIPLDSEHNAIYQCLSNKSFDQVKSIVLTSSGGPFLNTDHTLFATIKPKDALKHPRWSMGQKISIDSATMVNKCLEIIEAFFLFGCSARMIEVLVHPQAVVHGIVNFLDGSSISMLSKTDMRVPLAHCLSRYVKDNSNNETLDLSKSGPLTFAKVNNKKFPTVNFAYKLIEWSRGAPAYFNGANQRLVEKFLKEEIRFIDIFKQLQKTMHQLDYFFKNPNKSPSAIIKTSTVAESLEADYYGQEFINKLNHQTV